MLDWPMATLGEADPRRLTLFNTALWQVRWAMGSLGPVPPRAASYCSFFAEVQVHLLQHVIQPALDMLQGGEGVPLPFSSSLSLSETRGVWGVAWGCEPNGWWLGVCHPLGRWWWAPGGLGRPPRLRLPPPVAGPASSVVVEQLRQVL